jgi:hypothetical protein
MSEYLEKTVPPSFLGLSALCDWIKRNINDNFKEFICRILDHLSTVKYQHTYHFAKKALDVLDEEESDEYACACEKFTQATLHTFSENTSSRQTLEGQRRTLMGASVDYESNEAPVDLHSSSIIGNLRMASVYNLGVNTDQRAAEEMKKTCDVLKAFRDIINKSSRQDNPFYRLILIKYY